MGSDYEQSPRMNTSSPRQLSLSRDQVLVAHAAEMIARTQLSQDDFAQVLSSQLHRLIRIRRSARMCRTSRRWPGVTTRGRS
jgi:hypothetical protein